MILNPEKNEEQDLSEPGHRFRALVSPGGRCVPASEIQIAQMDIYRPGAWLTKRSPVQQHVQAVFPDRKPAGFL